MTTDVDFLITFYEKLSKKSNSKEFTEQEESSTSTSSSGGSGKAMPKWADVVGGPQRGKANRLGLGGEKWETGMNRGVSNQIW